jgi:quercetin dioxygenase-like cupin family protein
MDIKLAAVKPREIMPGYHGKMIHTEHMTLAYWDVDEGASVPEHAHHNEQLMQVLEGIFEFTVGGVTNLYHPGDIVVIAPEVPHSGRAKTPCKLMDIFSPAREDYR